MIMYLGDLWVIVIEWINKRKLKGDYIDGNVSGDVVNGNDENG